MAAMADGSATENHELKQRVAELEASEARKQAKITELLTEVSKVEERVEIEKVSGDRAVSALAADREKEIVALEDDLLKKTEELQGLQDYVEDLKQKVPTPSKSRGGTTNSAGVHMVSVSLDDEDDEEDSKATDAEQQQAELAEKHKQEFEALQVQEKALNEVKYEITAKDAIIADLLRKLEGATSAKEDEMSELEAALEKVNDELDENALALQKKTQLLEAATAMNDEMRGKMEELNHKMISLEETEGLARNQLGAQIDVAVEKLQQEVW